MTFSLTAKGEVCCRVCGATNDLQLHHVIPRSKFKEGKHELRNGITLCQACHAAWHAGKRPIHREVFTDEEWDYLTSVTLTGENIDAWLDDHYPEGVTGHTHKTPVQNGVGPAARPKCPSCLRPLPLSDKKEVDAPRVRKTWAVAVPVDEQEDGADVLDGLLDACRDLFGHDESKKVRYFTLAQALALVVQHGHVLVSDG